MLDTIIRLLFGEKGEPKQAAKPRTELSQRPGKQAQLHNSSSVNSFFFSIKGVGHHEYPILHKHYSPMSRIPCTDLVPFISNRIIARDIGSIKTIMRAVIEANPGVGNGFGWIDDSIDNILPIPFENFVSFSSENAYSELKALFIVAAKTVGPNREFLLTEEIPRLISWACIAHQPSWSTQLYSLLKKANSWITKMAKDIPYWQNYGKFKITKLPDVSIENSLREIILALSPAARMQLLYTVEKTGGALRSLTNYQIRSFGINIEKTSKEIVDSGLVVPSSSKGAIESAYSKRELVELCETHGVTYRKSWKKEKIVDTIQKMDPKLIKKISSSKNLVSPNYERYPDLRNVVRIADEHQVGFKLLCFA